ncbi:MAG: hypothetical protein QOI11_2688, partial [Candidatus Eremiobacteraeota bacterium]|nr:hypothetical protein [Candidatus Eremiobacteraeota bacterium]
MANDLSRLPAVHRILDEPRIARFVALLGAATVKRHAGAALAAARAAEAVPPPAAVVDEVLARCAAERRRGL